MLQVAHIIPFVASKNNKRLREMLSLFAGQDMNSLLTDGSINDPSNALLLIADVHEGFGLLLFGWECHNNQYFLRLLVPHMTCLHYSSDMLMAKSFFMARNPNNSTSFASTLQSSLCWRRFTCCCGTIDKILRDEDMQNFGALQTD
ncbi:hypothetical protein V1515DRAFT_465409 [Lipomyces mesembrius]